MFIVTISTSALFFRDVIKVTRSYTLDQTLQPRQLPISTEVKAGQTFFFEPSGLDRFYKPGRRNTNDWMKPGSGLPDPHQLLALSPQEIEFVSNFNSTTHWPKSSTWLYRVFNHLIRNAQQPRWSLDGWNFVPVDATVVDKEFQSVSLCPEPFYKS